MTTTKFLTKLLKWQEEIPTILWTDEHAYALTRVEQKATKRAMAEELGISTTHVGYLLGEANMLMRRAVRMRDGDEDMNERFMDSLVNPRVMVREPVKTRIKHGPRLPKDQFAARNDEIDQMIIKLIKLGKTDELIVRYITTMGMSPTQAQSLVTAERRRTAPIEAIAAITDKYVAQIQSNVTPIKFGGVGDEAHTLWSFPLVYVLTRREAGATVRQIAAEMACSSSMVSHMTSQAHVLLLRATFIRDHPEQLQFHECFMDSFINPSLTRRAAKGKLMTDAFTRQQERELITGDIHRSKLALWKLKGRGGKLAKTKGIVVPDGALEAFIEYDRELALSAGAPIAARASRDWCTICFKKPSGEVWAIELERSEQTWTVTEDYVGFKSKRQFEKAPIFAPGDKKLT